MNFRTLPQLIYWVLLGGILNSGDVLGQQQEKRSLFVKKIDQKIELDGALNEAVWGEAEVATDFWQMFPTTRFGLQTKPKLSCSTTTPIFMSVPMPKEWMPILW